MTRIAQNNQIPQFIPTTLCAFLYMMDFQITHNGTSADFARFSLNCGIPRAFRSVVRRRLASKASSDFVRPFN
jgi:hypothetical protein